MDGASYLKLLTLILYRGIIAVSIAAVAMPLLRIAFDARWESICDPGKNLKVTSIIAVNKCKSYELLPHSWEASDGNRTSTVNTTVNVPLESNNQLHWVTGTYITAMQVTMSIAGLQVCHDNLPLRATGSNDSSSSSGGVNIQKILVLVPVLCLVCQTVLSMTIYSQFQPFTSRLTMENASFLLNFLDGLLWVCRFSCIWSFVMMWWLPVKELARTVEEDGKKVLSHVLSEKALYYYAVPFTIASLVLVGWKSSNLMFGNIKTIVAVVTLLVPGLIFFRIARNAGEFGISPGIPYNIILVIVLSVWPSVVQTLTSGLLRESNTWDANSINNTKCSQMTGFSNVSCNAFQGKVVALIPLYLLVRIQLRLMMVYIKNLVRIAHGDEKYGYQLSSRLLWPFFLVVDLSLMMLFLEFEALDIEFCMLNLIFGIWQMMRDGGFLAVGTWKVWRSFSSSCKHRFCRKNTREGMNQEKVDEKEKEKQTIQRRLIAEWVVLQRSWCTECLSSESDLLATLTVLAMVCFDLSLSGVVSTTRAPTPSTRTMLGLETSSSHSWYGWKMPVSIVCVLTTRFIIAQLSKVAWHWRLREFQTRYQLSVYRGDIDAVGELDEKYFGLTNQQFRYRATMWNKHRLFFALTTIPAILYGIYLNLAQTQLEVETRFDLQWVLKS